MRELACLAISLCTLACFEDPGTEGDDEVGACAEVTPLDGDWNYIGEGVTNNSCPPQYTIANTDSALMVSYDGCNGLEIGQANGQDVECLLEGSSMSCGQTLIAEFPLPTLDLTVQAHQTIEAEFSSDAEAEGVQHIAVTCVGAGCGTLAEVPCNYDLPFSAVANL